MRPRIWRVKAATGLVLLAAQFVALAVIGLFLFRERYVPSRGVLDVAGMLICGVVGYAWGLYCGSFATNVLGAVARAVLLQAAWAAALYFAVMVVMVLYLRAIDQTLLGAIVPGVMALTAAGVAARSRTIYCRPDWLRAAVPGPGRGRAEGTRLGEQLSQACREARWFALGMGLYGLAGMAGLVFLGAASWPALTLVLGVACGVTVCAGERGWLVRAAVRFAIGAAAAALVTLVVVVPSLTRLEIVATGIRSFFLDVVAVSAASALATDPGLFLTLWLVEGFACGLLARAVFRKPLTAAAAGLAGACLFGGIWLPTVYTGGDLHAWPLWVTPAVFLAAALVVAHWRGAGRLTAGRLAAVTGGALLAAGSVTAAGLWVRANDMPPVPDAVDVEAFKATLPGPGQNVGGERMSKALLRLAAIERTFDDDLSLRPLAPGEPLPARRSFFLFTGDAERVINRGWKAADPHTADFLDRMFALDWAFGLADAAGLPTGVLIDPRDATVSLVAPQFEAATTAATLLSARGLQLQDHGAAEAFVDNLRTGLAVARALRHVSSSFAVSHVPYVESPLCRGVERWLERLDGRPDLLRRALDTLQRHLDAPPADPEVMRKVEYLIMLNAFADPRQLPRLGGGSDPFFPVALNDILLLRQSWDTPWEKMRLRRVLDGMGSADRELRELARQLAPPLVLAVYPAFNGSPSFRERQSQPHNLYPCRAAALQVALRLYQAETGRPAEKLDELVPKYLPAVPADPYDGRPFRYRLSRGETLDWAPEESPFGRGTTPEKREIPAGQGILWSVGEDKKDDGGHAQEWPHPGLKSRAEDRITLVPLPRGRP
jgi:hypothetical protein